jgi:hypothetical protein
MEERTRARTSIDMSFLAVLTTGTNNVCVCARMRVCVTEAVSKTFMQLKLRYVMHVGVLCHLCAHSCAQRMHEVRRRCI